jgi:glycosyltransferase involved in cell wall biosynthesis
MSRALSAPGFDVLLFPTIYTYVPVFTSARKLVMVHDVIAETFPLLTVPRRSARLFWNIKTALGRLQADALITVSEYSRACILKRFKTDPRRVFVVGEAADAVFRKLADPALSPKLESAGVDPAHRTVVYLGGFSPHKNLEALLAAFARVAALAEFADVRLVMVGDTSGDAFYSYFDTISRQTDALGLRERVRFTGYLDDADVVVLLNLASALVLPSFMEGFGLPAVEAAACGCPVIATKASPLPALLPDAGIFIDPNEDQIAAALVRLLSSSDLRRRMGESGLAAAARLTWEQAARQMMEVIHTVSLP